MAQILDQAYDGFNYVFDKYGDPRVQGWLLMDNPLPTIAMCLTYVYLVKVLGPRIMENRKPFELKGLLIFYNAAQVLLSAWIFYECMMSGWLFHYSLRCQPVDYSRSALAMRMVHCCWWYYFSKFTEFFDTFFFVLRKKTSQVTTLHVVHHGIMPLSVWFGVKFTPGGHSTFFGLLNTFVHIFMYFYYMVSAMGPQYQKFIWWKKHLTTLQMVQFVAIFGHAFQLLFTDCNYPRAFVWWIGMHAVMFFFLFSDFYKNAYKGKRPPKQSAKVAPVQKKEEKVSNGTKSAPVKVTTPVAKQASKSKGFDGFFERFAKLIPCHLPMDELYDDDEPTVNTDTSNNASSYYVAANGLQQRRKPTDGSTVAAAVAGN